MLGHQRRERPPGTRQGQVEGQGGDADGVGPAELGGQGLEPVEATGHEDEIGAPGGEGPGEGGADAGAGAGDESGLTAVVDGRHDDSVALFWHLVPHWHSAPDQAPR